MADTVAYLAMGLSVLLMLWITPRLVPTTPTWLLGLIALGAAALAAGFFLAYQWAGYRVLAYLDAVVFGLFAVQATFTLWLRKLTPPGDRQGAEAGGESQGVE